MERLALFCPFLYVSVPIGGANEREIKNGIRQSAGEPGQVRHDRKMHFSSRLGHKAKGLRDELERLRLPAD